jgi:hypothetical protein
VTFAKLTGITSSQILPCEGLQYQRDKPVIKLLNCRFLEDRLRSLIEAKIPPQLKEDN